MLYWLFRILFIPIVFPIFFIIGFIKDFFSRAFSSFIQFGICIASPLIFFLVAERKREDLVMLFVIGVIAILYVAFRVLYLLVISYFSFDFDLTIDFLDECGGHIKEKAAERAEIEREKRLKRKIEETTCAWCGSPLGEHYYTSFFIGDKAGRYCSRGCMSSAGY